MIVKPHDWQDWAAWVDRYKPSYPWWFVAVDVAVHVFQQSGRKCRVRGQRRVNIFRQEVWVWVLELAS